MKTSTIEVEYNEINSRNGWTEAFQSIKEKSEQEAKERKFALEESNKVNNRRLNRYRDVNPYDHSRIVLHKGDTDYINANLVKMEKANRKYILTQGPLQNTVGHFWLMVWEQNSKAILMLNKLIEKKQVKCHKYWPENKGTEHKMILTDVDLTVEYLKSEEFAHFTKRYFKLIQCETGKSREVIQFHYNTWPDFGVPSSPIAFLQFLKQVRDSGALNIDVGPAVVHCSAGIGRSGTFCLVDTCLVMIDNEGENKVSVQDLLLEMRRYRMGLIQTTDQLYFSYQAIIEGIKHLNEPGFNDYEEVPYISYDEENDDVPPPSPPPRGTSLSGNGTIASQMSRPLPSIPFSVSAHEFRDLRVLNSNSLDGIECATGTVINFGPPTMDRPLPPIPKDNSLEEVNESSSDDDDDDEEDDDEEKISENDSDTSNRSESDSKYISHSTLSPFTTASKDKSELLDSECSSLSKTDLIVTNGGVANVSGTVERTESTDIRRRKRIERQSAMEEKIKEIKRKQKEFEDEAARASKKRREHNKKFHAPEGNNVSDKS